MQYTTFQSTKLHFETVGNQSIGWGYQIYKNSKMVIDQQMIPGVGGRQRFSDKDQARKVAELVVKKMRLRPQFPPTVFEKELDSLNITYKRK